MAITDEKHYEFWGKVQEALGRIEANQANFGKYLDAVNANARETRIKVENHIADASIHSNGDFMEGLKEIKRTIETHVNDLSAHGAAPRGEVWALIGKIVAGLAGIIAIAAGLAKLIGPH